MLAPFPDPPALCGPLRRPRQMLAEQQYDGHKSIHDDATAGKLGLRAGPIEGPIEGPDRGPDSFEPVRPAAVSRVHAVMKASYATYEREVAELGPGA